LIFFLYNIKKLINNISNQQAFLVTGGIEPDNLLSRAAASSTAQPQGSI